MAQGKMYQLILKLKLGPLAVSSRSRGRGASAAGDGLLAKALSVVEPKDRMGGQGPRGLTQRR